MIRVLIGFLIWASCSCAQAAPLVYFALEGRTFGGDDAYTSNLEVQPGDTVEYRLRAWFASKGTDNDHLRNEPWHSYQPDAHGLNSLSISIVQDATDPIQVDFSTPVDFIGPSSPGANDSWGWRWAPDRGKPGVPTPRAGSTLLDLLGIRPLHAPGVFTARDPEIIFTGLLNVESVSGLSGQVSAEWGPVSGGGWFHGHVFYPTGPKWDDDVGRIRTESSFDPLTHFTPLTFTASSFQAVPEPSTMALLVSALVGLAWWKRRGLLTRARL